MSLSLWSDPFLTDPMMELRRMQRDMDSLFALSSKGTRGEVSWRPTMDIKETDKDIVLSTELPGVKKEDVKVELNNGVLTISGERKEEKKVEREKFYQMERSYGKFTRSISVPKELKEEQIKARLEHGVLEVCFPKMVGEKRQEPLKIPVS